MRAGVVSAFLAAGLLAAGPAAAAPPPNDDRGSAQVLAGLPASVSGSTVDSSVRLGPGGDPLCGPARGNVWYQVTTPSDQRLVVSARSEGELDVALSIYRRDRSNLNPLACDLTDRTGEALVTFGAEKGATYLIQVAQLDRSVAGGFTLQVFAPTPPASPPGRALPRGGVRQSVDAVRNPSDAWSVDLVAGVSYRVNLATAKQRCVALAVYGPNPKRFERPVFTRRCGGYGLFTPGIDGSGSYSVVVEAGPAAGRGAVGYALNVASAGPDDTAPGIPLANDARVAGRIDGSSLDTVDLYRFDVVTRSDVDLGLAGVEGLSMRLLDDGGRGIRIGTDTIRARLSSGRYFVVVRANPDQAGRYVLRRLARQITSTSLSSSGELLPGTSARLDVRVTPGVDGPVRVIIDRFDPLAGWQFARAESLRAVAGRATVTFTPPAVGRWRARAAFLGTRTASPSESGTVRMLVAGPLAP